jgi:hypothetical protein
MQQTPSTQTLATVVLTLEPYSAPSLKATVTLQKTGSRHCAATTKFEGSQKQAEFGFLRWSTVPWRLYLKAVHLVLTRAHLHRWNLDSIALFRQASIEVFVEVGAADPVVSVVMVDLARMRAVLLEGYPEVARAEYSLPQSLLLQPVADMLDETVCTLTQTPRKPRPKPP